MSVARHHAEWLSLIEISGPFLSMPVLRETFPQGLDAHDAALSRTLRTAYEEWREDQASRSRDPAIHSIWVRFILTKILGFRPDLIAEGQSLPPGLQLRVPEHHETLRPDLALLAPAGSAQAGSPRLLVQRCAPEQGLERPLDGATWKASPAMRMMELLRGTGVALGLLTNGEQWMLVWARPGEPAAFASWHAELWLDEPITLRAFRSLLGLRRFFGVPEDETLEALLAESSQHQEEVTEQLGYQVRRAVELLVRAIDAIDPDRHGALLGSVGEKRLYRAALTVMMRLVFLFSAEERGLLLLGEPVYDQHYAVSTLRAQLREAADQQGEEVLERRSDAWSRLLAAFRAVHGGIQHERLSLPPYGGALFDPDRYPFLEGRAGETSWLTTPADPLPIDNRTVLHLLEALQLLQIRTPGGGPPEARRLSFRALDIEQIGHVYEGLLDHTAVRAESPVLGLAGAAGLEPEIELERLELARAKGEAELLDLLKRETKRSLQALKNALSGEPTDAAAARRLLRACRHDQSLYERILPFGRLLRTDARHDLVIIPAGGVYVTQGADRRTTGAHYTPRSLTESIVQHALDPLVYEGPSEGAPAEEWRLRPAEAILDLKVCDPAMGSGAFLVQSCRYLAERLVEAWQIDEEGSRAACEQTVRSGWTNGDAAPEQRTPSCRPLLFLTPEGRLTREDAPSNRPLPRDAEERLTLARRIIADHCLYGVDCNPMAVEMAKLSLWLVTLAKGKPFTFLDHRLKQGDSLVGAIWRRTASGRLIALPERIPDEAFAGRGAAGIVDVLKQRNAGQTTLDWTVPAAAAAEYERMSSYADTPEGQQAKADRYRQIQADPATRRRLAAADLWCAAWLWPLDPGNGLRCPTTPLYRNLLEKGASLPPDLEADLDALRERIPFFHWGLEWPDVLAQGGFDAVAGNPPFQGGQRITGALGTDYRDYLVRCVAGGKRGSADLCAYFFLRAVSLLRQGGIAGLLATNTIAQGDTREVGLEQLVREAVIIRAEPSRPWPGAANLEISTVWASRGDWTGTCILSSTPPMSQLVQRPGRVNRASGDQSVPAITPSLTACGAATGKPHRLKANAGKSFQGSIVLGMGFVLTPEESKELIQRDPRNRDVLFPYLNGEDLNQRPDQSPSRWVINFFDWPATRERPGRWDAAAEDVQAEWRRTGDVPADYPGPVAADYPDCFEIVVEKVRPERLAYAPKNAWNISVREKWWQFGAWRTTLAATIAGLGRVLVTARVSAVHAMHWSYTRVVLSDRLCVIALEDSGSFGLLSSTIHDIWAHRPGSTTHETREMYNPEAAYETFAFPSTLSGLMDLGESYHEHRRQVMQARREGLTKTYNRFHRPEEIGSDIAQLRQLHIKMDQAVAASYGWSDLDLGHDFREVKQGIRFTVSEFARLEILDRLLQLNHQRYAEELAQGLHEKGAGGKGKKPGPNAATPPTGAAGFSRRLLVDPQHTLAEAPPPTGEVK